MFQEINHKAMTELCNQNFVGAQKLLFENAKKNPCHETFNNLGYFLCTEGLFNNNDDRIRSADVLGMKYLIKAVNIKLSVKNLCAIATAIDLRITWKAKKKEDFCTYENAFKVMDKALQLHYYDMLEYDKIRFLYLYDANNYIILESLRRLVKTYICEESVTFYLYVLCRHFCFEECLDAIKKYEKYIETADLLNLYFLCGAYDKCASCFKPIIDGRYGLDEVGDSIMIECLIKTGRFDEAEIYADYARGSESDDEYHSKQNCGKTAFDDLTESTEYRCNLIAKHKEDLFGRPRYITPCCYFGCVMHDDI